MNPLPEYVSSIITLAECVFPPQQGAMRQTAERMAKTIQEDGRIFIFGTGHPHILCEVNFFRAGGLACVVAVFVAALESKKPAFIWMKV